MNMAGIPPTGTDVSAERANDSQVSKRFLSKDESIDLLTNHLADTGLRDDLADLVGDTTDNLGPIQ